MESINAQSVYQAYQLKANHKKTLLFYEELEVEMLVVVVEADTRRSLYSQQTTTQVLDVQ